MNKKILFILIFVLLIFAGFIAITQESNFFLQNIEAGKIITSGITAQPKWFRSNSGGMALEETFSKTTAFRYEYALSIETPDINEMPNQLFAFIEDGFYPELRTLFKNGEKTRRQWLLNDKNGITRLNAVLSDELNNENGFIEIFSENSFLITEYRFFENGKSARINYTFNDNILISCAYFINENDSLNSGYVMEYTDLYRYNRLSTLRAIERIFHSDILITYEDTLKIDFPRNIMEAAGDSGFISERINLYPPFFGDVYTENNFRIIYETDDRGRVLSQTYLDDNDEVIWVIQNVWLDNRIVSSKKTEGGTVLLAEYEYNQNGEKLIERNYKNGLLERLVRAEGNVDIEELFFNNVLVLRAVWEDGRKISETRIR